MQISTQPNIPATGTLRLNRAATPPWQYRGDLTLPAGRTCAIEACIAEDASGKFFQLRAGLAPGMTAAELEAVLTECEQHRAQQARQEIDAETSDELPF